MHLENIKTLLIDGDGVLWKADKPIDGLNHFFDTINQLGINWALLTNNNTKTAQDYVQKLLGFGIAADESVVFTSSTVTAEYLKIQYGEGALIHVVGMGGLLKTTKQAGFMVSHGDWRSPSGHREKGISDRQT